MITHSNYRLLEKYKQRKVDCSVDNWECRGSNLWVEVYKPLNKVASNFTVERTIISYGVNFITGQITSPFSNGAGAIVRVEPGLEYDVHITISKCYFSNNIALYATHLQVGIYSNCSLLIENSNFTHANKKRSGPMKLVPVVHPSFAVVYLFINDEYSGKATLDVKIVMKDVQIADNDGSGLHVSLVPTLSQSCIQLRLQKVKLVQNFLVHETFQFFRALVQFHDLMANSADVSIILESVEMSNNNLVFPDEYMIPEQIGISALSVVNTEVHCKGTEFFNNNMSAVYIYNSDLHFHGNNVFKTNTGNWCGGAIVLRVDSHIYLHRGAQVYILENTALKYGGGICVDDGSMSEYLDTCFYQIVDLDIVNNNDTFVYLEGNVAPITGYDIYAGNAKECVTKVNSRHMFTNIKSRATFFHVFRFGLLNSSLSTLYRVSSDSLFVCFCNERQELMCDESVVPHISVYPGQAFKILAVGMGVGISPAVVRSRISDKYDIFPELQSLGNACEPLNYIILAPGNLSGIRVWLTVVLF